MLIDQLKIHTKTVQHVAGPTKRFPTKEGERERYDIMFGDGYKCEYCPLVAPVIDIPKVGQQITFKVKYRGGKGDEIEILKIETNDGPATDAALPGRIYSMSGHPASIALSSAVKFAELKLKEGEKAPDGLLLSEMLEDADGIYDWLLMKANGC